MRALEDLVSLLTRLPGIGRKSALRMAYYLLKADQRYAGALAERIAKLQGEIRFCSICGSYTETDPCPVCDGLDRDRRVICVVEQPQDVLTIEASKEYRGLYHVLGGLLSPLDGIGPDKLRIASLVQRIRTSGKAPPAAAALPGELDAPDGGGRVPARAIALEPAAPSRNAVEEIVLATNPTVEGDTTALYIKKVLEREGVKVTRLATGIPVGGDLEYADRLTLARSFHGRMPL
ncbi:MAG TPA: recombination mediator RecR [Rectinemataceae bacterium]|nr:recombination mediator RecR [Rectinemataceae bacterium]